MSQQNVAAFWQKVSSNSELRQELEGNPVDDFETGVGHILKLAAESGFPFTREEYDAAIQEELKRQHAADELSEEELAGVTGGTLLILSRGCLGGALTAGGAGGTAGTLNFPTIMCFQSPRP